MAETLWVLNVRGVYPLALEISRICWRVASLTPALLLRARETAALETPASLAISSIFINTTPNLKDCVNYNTIIHKSLRHKLN